jgi:type I restriction enzyme S subunit
MSEWTNVILKNITVSANTGLDAIKRAPIVEKYTGIKCLRIQDISQNKSFDKWGNTEVTPENYEKFRLREGEIIMARTCSTGLNLYVKKDLSAVFNNGLVRIRTHKEKAIPKFLYYLFMSKEFIGHIDGISGGTSVQLNMQVGDLLSYEFLLPPLLEQERIAEVLSSIDDKIELLHRNNKTLEQLAETLFRQWFVEEAETKPVKHFGKIVCGKTPSKNNSHFFNGPISFLKIPDMHGKTFVFTTTDSLTEEGKNSQLNKTIPPLSISVSCIATVGLVTINAFECQTNQQINTIIPNKEYYRYYLYNYFKSITDDLIQRASSGSVTHNLNTGDFSNIEIPYFSEKLFISFNENVEPLYQKIFKNQIQIQQLETLRDTLLPKLMSGVVRVNE